MNARMFARCSAAALAVAAIAAGAAQVAPRPMTIVLPAPNAAFRSALGVELARKDCLACHSSEYVTQQPPLSNAGWTNEITKMRAAYGASIPDADTDPLVAYLLAQNPVAKQ